jgi:hypothetical protein
MKTNHSLDNVANRVADLIVGLEAQLRWNAGSDFIEKAPAMGNVSLSKFRFQSNIQPARQLIRFRWRAGETATVLRRPDAGPAASDGVVVPFFPAMPENASAPQENVGEGRAIRFTLNTRPIFIGDVWVLGGQSNMEFPITKA